MVDDITVFLLGVRGNKVFERAHRLLVHLDFQIRYYFFTTSVTYHGSDIERLVVVGIDVYAAIAGVDYLAVFLLCVVSCDECLELLVSLGECLCRCYLEASLVAGGKADDGIGLLGDSVKILADDVRAVVRTVV